MEIPPVLNHKVGGVPLYLYAGAGAIGLVFLMLTGKKKSATTGPQQAAGTSTDPVTDSGGVQPPYLGDTGGFGGFFGSVGTTPTSSAPPVASVPTVPAPPVATPPAGGVSAWGTGYGAEWGNMGWNPVHTAGGNPIGSDYPNNYLMAGDHGAGSPPSLPPWTGQSDAGGLFASHYEGVHP